MNTMEIRDDLAAAQAAAWRHVTTPGTCWSGAERAAMANVALAALDDPDPLPPWVTPSSAGRSMPGTEALPALVSDAVYRMSRHAATLTEEWYRTQIAAGIDPVAYVEMVGVVVAVAAVDGFARAAGSERPPLPPAVDGPPRREHPAVESATLNWVVVAAPADRSAAVVQGLSAVPEEFANLERLAAAQYIPMFEMDDHAWNRGTLSRPDMELVAARLSAARECFY
jgi:hypothetical protein